MISQSSALPIRFHSKLAAFCINCCSIRTPALCWSVKIKVDAVTRYSVARTTLLIIARLNRGVIEEVLTSFFASSAFHEFDYVLYSGWRKFDRLCDIPYSLSLFVQSFYNCDLISRQFLPLPILQWLKW